MTHMHHRPQIVFMIAAVLVWGCGSSPSTPSSIQVPNPADSASPEVSTATLPAVTPAPSGGSFDPLLKAVVVTVSDRLRVRSEPRVSDDSIRYEPVLPLGTELTVLDGPVSASGYVWYRVAPVSFVGLEGPGYGWVASAGKDGEPWIALAESPIAGIEPAKADMARAPADPVDAKSAAASINAFGFDLFRAMLADPALDLSAKNAVFSPASIALALGMARAGARGDTAAQMDGVLHTNGWSELGAGLNALDQALASRNATWTDSEGASRQVALRIANGSFAQRGWTIENGFLDAISSAFGAGVQLVDYAADPEAARRAINAWVSQQTARRIPELLRPENVSPLTRLYLVNAVYLKAEWERWFREDETESASFTRLDGTRVDVPMMYRVGAGSVSSDPIPYVHGAGWQAVELRYRHAEDAAPLAMTLVLPDDVAAFETRLSADLLARITAALDDERKRIEGPQTCPSNFEPGNCYPYDLRLFMPRFAIGTRVALKDALSAIGMPLAFDRARADLTGIHVPEPGEGRPFVSAVIHQANIDVDEKGTEAAAATAVGIDTGGGPSPLDEVTLRLDHPFLFVLRDVETGAVLFMGRVVDPSLKRGN
jgi:serpin B